MALHPVGFATGGVSVEAFYPGDLEHGTSILIHGGLDGMKDVPARGNGFSQASGHAEGDGQKKQPPNPGSGGGPKNSKTRLQDS